MANLDRVGGTAEQTPKNLSQITVKIPIFIYYQEQWMQHMHFNHLKQLLLFTA